METPRLISRREAARIAGCSEATIRRAEKNGELPSTAQVVNPGTPKERTVIMHDALAVQEFAAKRASATGAAHTDLRTESERAQTSPTEIDGTMLALLFSAFKDGLLPVDIVIKFRVRAALVERAWQDYCRLHRASLVADDEERLANVEETVSRHEVAIDHLTMDANGNLYDGRLPQVLDHDLPQTYEAIRSLQAAVNSLQREVSSMSRKITSLEDALAASKSEIRPLKIGLDDAQHSIRLLNISNGRR